jgi:hypothetical protein
VCFDEASEKRPFLCMGVTVVHRLPAHDVLVSAFELPDIATAPVTDWLARAEVAVLTKL